MGLEMVRVGSKQKNIYVELNEVQLDGKCFMIQ